MLLIVTEFTPKGTRFVNGSVHAPVLGKLVDDDYYDIKLDGKASVPELYYITTRASHEIEHVDLSNND